MQSLLNSGLLLATLAAFGFGTAPLIGRGAKLPPATMALMVGLGTLLAVLPGGMVGAWQPVSTKSLALALLAGVINGAGLYFFYTMLAGAGKHGWSLSQLAPVTYVAMLLILVVGGIVIYHEPLTPIHRAGVITALAAILMLSR